MRPKQILLLSFMLLLLFSGCTEKQPEITSGVDACSVCNMIIDQTNQACGFVEQGEFKPFDSPGCLLRQLDEMKKENQAFPTEIYFADYKAGALFPQKLTTFLLTDHIPTVMNGRVLTFATKEDAQQMSKFPDEVITDFQGYLTLRGRPDKRVMIELHEESIFPEVVSVSKGDIVEWSCISTNSKTDVKFRIQGYEEIGEIVVPTGGEIVRIRMLAERPGSGFPIMRTSDGKVLGMLKVSGAHTKDEESM